MPKSTFTDAYDRFTRLLVEGRVQRAAEGDKSLASMYCSMTFSGDRGDGFNSRWALRAVAIG